MICNRMPCIRLTHVPTGMQVKVDMVGKYRTQKGAYAAAMVMLKSRLFAVLGAVDQKDVVEELLHNP